MSNDIYYDNPENYELLINESEARSKVHKLKQFIKSLGEVNTGSIKEYECKI